MILDITNTDHKVSSQQIYWSVDYDKFSFLKGNRVLNERKIKRIMQDIRNGVNVLAYFPILVNEDMQILDGQHRYSVAKRMQKKIYYIIARSDFKLAEIAQVNSRNEKWKPGDYVNCYIENENPNYQILKDFREKYGFSWSDCVSLLFFGTVSTAFKSDYMDNFKQGLFAAREPERAHHIASKVALFQPFQAHKTRAFIKAIELLIKAELVDWERLTEKVNSRVDTFKRRVNHKEYLSQLEDFYNIGNQYRKRIY